MCFPEIEFEGDAWKKNCALHIFGTSSCAYIRVHIGGWSDLGRILGGSWMGVGWILVGSWLDLGWFPRVERENMHTCN